MTKLVVTNVSVVADGRYTVNFAGQSEVTDVTYSGFGSATNLSLSLSEDEARQYFPGDVYELTLKKSS